MSVAKRVKKASPEEQVRVTWLTHLGPLFVVPNGADVSLALAKILSEKLAAKGARLADKTVDATIICLSESLSLDAVKSIFKAQKLVTADSTASTSSDFGFGATVTSLRWARAALSSRQEIDPGSHEFLWNGVDVWKRLEEEAAKDAKQVDPREFVPREFPTEFASGAKSLLHLIAEEEILSEESLQRIPVRYREKVASMSKLPSPN